MTGPEHYKLAEDLLVEFGEQEPVGAEAGYYLNQAQVHAALALAAATAMAAYGDMPVYDSDQWQAAVAGTPPTGWRAI